MKSKKKKRRKREEEREKIVKMIREKARKEKMRRERRGLAELIKRKWDEFLEEKKLEREIKKGEREHEKERLKKIMPDDGFGD